MSAVPAFVVIGAAVNSRQSHGEYDADLLGTFTVAYGDLTVTSVKLLRAVGGNLYCAMPKHGREKRIFVQGRARAQLLEALIRAHSALTGQGNAASPLATASTREECDDV